MEQVDNKYQPSDWRSLEMHRLIAKKLEANPSLVERARSNISRWKSLRGETPAYSEWEDILSSGNESILRALTGEDQESAGQQGHQPPDQSEHQPDGLLRLLPAFFLKRNARRSTLAGTEGNHSKLVKACQPSACSVGPSL